MSILTCTRGTALNTATVKQITHLNVSQTPLFRQRKSDWREGVVGVRLLMLLLGIAYVVILMFFFLFLTESNASYLWGYTHIFLLLL